MRVLFMVLLISATVVLASGRGDYAPEPNPVESIEEALTGSGMDWFTPGVYEEDGLGFSYQLVSVRYLGIALIGSETYVLGTAFFIRSSPMGCDSPPARGHGYLLCLTPEFELVTYCELAEPDLVLLSGASLIRGEEVIADFSGDDESVMLNGFLVDGYDFLEYPLSGEV